MRTANGRPYGDAQCGRSVIAPTGALYDKLQCDFFSLFREKGKTIHKFFYSFPILCGIISIIGLLLPFERKGES